MFSFLKRRKEPAGPVVENLSFLEVDMHSHLIPGIDDGSPDLETSLELIRGLQEQGYRKLITTPHVMSDFYANSNEDITAGFAILKAAVADAGIDIELGIAAEYYLDMVFLNQILPEGLLTFGDNYLLVEVGMAGWPRQFDDMIFSALSKGYKVILAHPERYQFEGNVKTYEELKKKGVLLQLNTLSATGYYGPGVLKMANELLDRGLYDFCGTDTHHARHVTLQQGLTHTHQPMLAKLAAYPHFRNKTL